MFDDRGAAWSSQTDWRTGLHVPRESTPVRSAWRRAPQPGVLSRRPLRFFEGLDGGFRLLRFAPALTVGLALIVFTLWMLALGALVSGIVWASFGVLEQVFADPDSTIGLMVIVQYGSVSASLVSLSLVHLLAGVASVGARAAFDSQRMSLSAGWAALHGVRRRLVRATALLFALHIAGLTVLSIPALVLAGLGAGTAALIVLGVALLAWFGLTVYFALRTAFVGCAIAHERLTIRQALRRSWALTRRGFWRTAGQLVVGYILSNQLISIMLTPVILILYIVLIILSFTFVTTSAAQAFGAAVAIVFALVAAFITFTASAVLFAYLAALVSVVYFDRLMRQEGFDLVLLRQAEEAGAS